MTKRKVRGLTEEQLERQFWRGTRADRETTVVPDSPRLGLDALVERVIEACAEAAVWHIQNEPELTGESIRAAVRAAGRRATKGETT